MMGRQSRGQEQLFYQFSLDEVVPADHLVRRIDAVLERITPNGHCRMGWSAAFAHGTAQVASKVTPLS